MYGQRDIRWKSDLMGFGVGTIGTYGCYLTSLANGLNQKGYSFTPATLNELFKQNDLWIGPYKNYIDVSQLPYKLPSIFAGFERVDNWGNSPSLDEIVKDNIIALGEVDGKPIGGTTHFVLITNKNRATAVIHDPWSDIEEKITVRWKDYGNILGLRLFTVNPQSETAPIDSSSLDYKRAEEVLKAYRTERLAGPEGNWEGYVRAIVQSDREIAGVREDLENCRVSKKQIPPSYESSLGRLFNYLANYFEQK